MRGAFLHLFTLVVGTCLTYILFAGSVCPSAVLSTQNPLQETVFERFKVSRDSQHLLLPIHIKGKRYFFMLDTAATITVYDTSLRSLLGEPFRAAVLHTTDGGEKRIPLFRSPSAKLGHLKLPTEAPVLCVDLGKLRKLCKEEIYGALGIDFLKDHVFRIDFDQHEVVFLRSVGTDPGVRVPVTFENYNIPQVKIIIPGLKERERFLVDTGFAGITTGELRAEVFDVLVKRHFLTLAGTSKNVTILGSGDSQQGLVDAVSLGKFCHKKLLFGRSKLSLLGINYWRRYVVTFDFANRAMYLKKGHQFDRTDDGKKKGPGAKKTEKKMKEKRGKW